MSDNKQTSFHWLVGGVITVIGIFAVAGHVMLSSQADNVGTTANIENTVPTVDSVTISSTALSDDDDFPTGIDLSPSATSMVFINGQVSDLNGYEDIISIETVLYKSTATAGSECEVNANDCYKAAWTTLDPAGCDLDIIPVESYRFSCTINLEYYAHATDVGSPDAAANWLAYVRVTDTAETTANLSSAAVEVNTLLSLVIPPVLEFSTPLTAGTATTDADNAELVIIQAGNDAADVRVSMAAAMGCDRSEIPVGNLKWSLTDTTYATATNILSTSATATSRNIGLQTSAIAPSGTLYFNVLPPTGVAGICSGTLVVETIAS